MANRSPGGGLNIASPLLNLILFVFVVGWLASLAAEIFKPDYSAPTGLNETMIALVTALFVAQQRLAPKHQDTPPAQPADATTPAPAPAADTTATPPPAPTTEGTP